MYAECQAFRALQQWDVESRHPAERPQRAERRIAGRFESLRRGTEGGGRDERVVTLLEQLGEARGELRHPAEGAEIVEGAHVAPVLDPGAQRARELVPARLVFPAQVDRNLAAADGALPLEDFVQRRDELDFLHGGGEL